MKKRGKLRLWIFGLAAVAVLGASCCELYTAAGRTGTALNYTYQRAMNDLTDSVSAMRSTLEKAPFVGTPVMQTAVSAQLSSHSGMAKAALSALPLSQEKTEKISRFLSQSGDYALSLSRRAAAGEALTDDDIENLATLLDYAEKLELALQNAQAQLATGDTAFTADGLFSNLEEAALPTLDDNFDNAAAQLAEVPTLLYDGPFSEHISQKEPLFLAGRDEITKEQAEQTAAEFLNCTADALSFTGEGGDRLAVYSFTHDGSHVNITKLGGIISYFKKEAIISGSKLGYDDVLEKTKEILRQMGIENFTETYYVISDNLCTINFAATTAENIVCYPDLIKVTVELEQGGMVELDMTGYVMNHRERALKQPLLTVEQAESKLSPLLSVSENRLAVVPTYSLDEALCYEFLCTSENGRELLVYINCETGLEEQLYILQRDEHGVLVI